jgi:Flp pilus assembly protein TadD
VLAAVADSPSADLALASAHARIASARGDLSEALRRYERAKARFPRAPSVRVSLAWAFDDMGQAENADATLAEALEEFPAHPDLLHASGWLATRRRDWTEAERRWDLFRKQVPGHPAATVGYAELLRSVGRLDEATSLLTEALHKHPNHFELIHHMALVTSFRREWKDALPRWEKLKSLQPGNEALQTEISAAVWQARLDLALAEADGDAIPPFEIPSTLLSSNADDQETLAALFTRFESLGDGCEFGMVQRRFHAEPLGLLRWTAIGGDVLVHLLDTRFEGVGAPPNVALNVWDGEYVTLDKRFGMVGHTFTRENAEPRERFLQQQCRRLAYLGRKLIEDLELGEKIFVYVFKYDKADDYIVPMYKSIRRFNQNNTLFCVRLDKGPSPSCRVEQADAGLFIGYMDRFSTVDINYAGWIQICRSVAELVKPQPTISE